MGLNIVNYAISHKDIIETVDGAGAIKGANCTIKETETVEEGIKVVFEWETTSGVVTQTEIVVPKGDKGDQGEKGDTGEAELDVIDVDVLPTENIRDDAIYRVPSKDPGEVNVYDEYIHHDGEWELFGGVDMEAVSDEDIINIFK